MKDFFSEIRQDIKNTVKFYQQEIDGEFSEDSSAEVQSNTEVVAVQKPSMEEDEKLVRFRKFIGYHRESVNVAGTLLYEILDNIFDAFFFVLIKRKTAFEDRNNIQKFGLTDGEISQLQASIHPASISSIATKGIPAYLLLGLQKAVSRLATGESISFAQKSSEQDELTNEESWKTPQPKRKAASNFGYEVSGMRVRSHWGSEKTINQILTILSEEFNSEEDDIFFLGVDVRGEDVVSYSHFNDFVMMPILQHFIQHFFQANASSISQFVSFNSPNKS